MSRATSSTLVKRVLKSISILTAMVLLASCGLFGASPESETPPETRVPVPTFTATVEAAVAPTPTQPPAAPPAEAAQPSQPEPAAATPTNTEVPPTPTTAAPATDTPAPKAQVVVTQAQVNTRNGPGTEYGLAGSANQNDRFDVVAKNAAGDWWKVCCVNGQQVWIFGQLVSAENVANVAVDPNIPAPPVAQQPTPAPAQPTQAPAAQPTNTSAPPPPAASDPCAGIGGDGCKFKLKSGPATAANGGNELKLQLYFIHSGIEGGQPQGSYFVALFKDGQKLPVSDAVRSIALEKNNGTLGQYNYEFTLQLSQIPGNSVAGNYSIFVLDGNGERDSKDFGFSIPDGQGLVYIVFDQG